MRSLVRYHGGKTKLAPWIISHMAPHRVYAEIFGGGFSVGLAKEPAQTSIYNDIDDDIVNLFQQIRDNGDALLFKQIHTLYSATELRRAYEHTDDPLERALRTLIRGHMAISTTSRIQYSGFRGKINCGDYCSQANTWFTLSGVIQEMRERLAKTIIEKRPALELFDRYDTEQTLWYLDPPYTNGERSKKSVKLGYVHNMSDSDHVILLNRIQSLKGKCMISGYDNEIYNDMLSGWVRHETKGFTDNSKKDVIEVLWCNYKKETLF